MAATRSTIVLVHAPLVGPSSWQWVAASLSERGESVVVPVLHDPTRAPSFEGFVEVIATSVTDDELILVGHSGSGVLLPSVATAVAPAHVRYVFVDAGLPPLAGRVVLVEPPVRASLEARVEADGLLPPWHTWWGEEAMRGLVPDEHRRASVMADIPRLPLAFFDTTTEVPQGWAADSAEYILLSEIYRTWADTARSYGWPVDEVPGTHLELVNRPDEVAAAIVRAAHPKG